VLAKRAFTNLRLALASVRLCAPNHLRRYDKVKIVLKEIINCQYTACMNPTAGSFNITPRMQRQFVTLAVQMPGADIVRSVYYQIIDGHISGFDLDVSKMSGKLVDASIELHRAVMNNFLPSAVKFHYQFNLREMSNITQGLCRMVKEQYRDPVKVARLWVHECERVFRDRMVNEADMTKFDEFRYAVTKKYFDADVGGVAAVEERPILYASFLTFSADDQPLYTPVTSFEVWGLLRQGAIHQPTGHLLTPALVIAVGACSVPTSGRRHTASTPHTRRCLKRRWRTSCASTMRATP
jgi:hypothetical protein